MFDELKNKNEQRFLSDHPKNVSAKKIREQNKELYNLLEQEFKNFSMGIIGVVKTTDSLAQLNALPDGIYEAQTAGKYANGLTAKEGYLTRFEKKGTKWTLFIEIFVGSHKIEAGLDEFVVGGKDGITSRKITGSDIINKPSAPTDNPFIIPTFNFILDKWTSGLRASKNPSYATLAQRLNDGRLKASKAIQSDDLVPYEQMPIKRFINKDLANKYAEEFGAEGELIIVVNENRRVYQINEHKNLQVLIDKGSSNNFTSLSDTPDSYPKEDYNILRNKDGKLIFTTLLPADFKIPNKTERQVLIYESEREGFKAIPYSEDALPNTFAKRTDDGRVKVAEPIDEDDAIPLSMFNEVFGEYMLRNGENLTPEDIELLRKILEVPTINPEELGKVDTVDGVKPDKNKNVQLNALVKNKVNEVGEEFSLKKGNTTLSFDEERLRYKTELYNINIGNSHDGAFLDVVRGAFDSGQEYHFSVAPHEIQFYADYARWSISTVTEGLSLINLPTTEEGYRRTLAVSWNGVFADEYGDIKTSAYIEITYQELVEKRDKGELSPGMYYRITDYVTKTNSEGGWYRSAEHPFDVIVQAVTNNTLDHNAKADIREGDEYFSGVSDLSKWELKYDLDNDADKYEWADTENGKGVIYFMKDENNNELPYDFKSIQFKVYKCSNVILHIQNVDAEDNSLEDHKSLIGQYCVMNNNLGLAEEMLIRDFNDFKFLYTFHLLDEETLNEFESDVKGVKNLEASNNPLVKTTIVGNKMSSHFKTYMNNEGLIINKYSLNNNVFHLQGEDYYFGVNGNDLNGATSDNFFRGGFSSNTINSFFKRNYVGPMFISNVINGQLHTNVFDVKSGCAQNKFDANEMNFVYIKSGSFSNNDIKGNFTRNTIISSFLFNKVRVEMFGCLLRGVVGYNDITQMNNCKVFGVIANNKINMIQGSNFYKSAVNSTFLDIQSCSFEADILDCEFLSKVVLSKFKSNYQIKDSIFSGALNLDLDLSNLRIIIEFNGNNRDLENKNLVSEFSKFSVTPYKISIEPSANPNTLIMSSKISANNTEEFDVTI